MCFWMFQKKKNTKQEKWGAFFSLLLLLLLCVVAVEPEASIAMLECLWWFRWSYLSMIQAQVHVLCAYAKKKNYMAFWESKNTNFRFPLFWAKNGWFTADFPSFSSLECPSIFQRFNGINFNNKVIIYNCNFVVGTPISINFQRDNPTLLLPPHTHYECEIKAKHQIFFSQYSILIVCMRVHACVCALTILCSMVMGLFIFNLMKFTEKTKPTPNWLLLFFLPSIQHVVLHTVHAFPRRLFSNPRKKTLCVNVFLFIHSNMRNRKRMREHVLSVLPESASSAN